MVSKKIAELCDSDSVMTFLVEGIILLEEKDGNFYRKEEEGCFSETMQSVPSVASHTLVVRPVGVIYGAKELEDNALCFHLWDRDSGSLKLILLQRKYIS